MAAIDGAGHGVVGVSSTVGDSGVDGGLLKPSDWCCTVRIDFNVARDSRWLTRSASRPLPPALSRCPLTNLVGEDNQRRRTPAVLRPWTLAGPTDAAGALNRTVHLQDADGCESSLSVEVTPAWWTCG